MAKENVKDPDLVVNEATSGEKWPKSDSGDAESSSAKDGGLAPVDMDEQSASDKLPLEPPVGSSGGSTESPDVDPPDGFLTGEAALSVTTQTQIPKSRIKKKRKHGRGTKDTDQSSSDNAQAVNGPGEGRRPYPRPTSVGSIAPPKETVPMRDHSLDSAIGLDLPTTPVAMPLGRVARFSGNTIKLGSEIHLVHGDEIKLRGKTYQLKAEETFRPMFFAKAAGLLVMGLLSIVGLAFLFGGKQGGELYGVVIDGNTGRIIPAATVNLEGRGNVLTSSAGIFRFTDIDVGEYSLTATFPGYRMQSGRVKREPGANAHLSFALAPALSMTPDSSQYDSPSASEDVQKNMVNEPPKVKFGALQLKVDFEDFFVYLDGNLVGKDEKRLKRIEEGTHKITIEKSGYETYRTEIKVRANSTATVELSLSNLEKKIDPVKEAQKALANGKEALNRTDYRDAIKSFTRVLDFSPHSAEAFKLRGWAFFKSGQLEKSLVDLVTAADMAADAGRYMEAVEAADFLLEVKPQNVDYLIRRGDYQVALTEYGKAIEDYKRAIDEDKKSLRGRLALAEAYFKAKDYKESAKEFDRARKMSDNPGDIYVRLCFALLHAGEDNKLRDRYKEFAEFASSDRMAKLREDPEWQRVLMIVGADERMKQ